MFHSSIMTIVLPWVETFSQQKLSEVFAISFFACYRPGLSYLFTTTRPYSVKLGLGVLTLNSSKNKWPTNASFCFKLHSTIKTNLFIGEKWKLCIWHSNSDFSFVTNLKQVIEIVCNTPSFPALFSSFLFNSFLYD